MQSRGKLSFFYSDFFSVSLSSWPYSDPASLIQSVLKFSEFLGVLSLREAGGKRQVKVQERL